jgi:5-methylcytosine-specific restriction endonuclease McrA
VHKEYNCNDLLSGTLDHIIPLAKGGDHTYENIKLAHMICNSYKSDKVVGGVLG